MRNNGLHRKGELITFFPTNNPVYFIGYNEDDKPIEIYNATEQQSPEIKDNYGTLISISEMQSLAFALQMGRS